MTTTKQETNRGAAIEIDSPIIEQNFPHTSISGEERPQSSREQRSLLSGKTLSGHGELKACRSIAVVEDSYRNVMFQVTTQFGNKFSLTYPVFGNLCSSDGLFKIIILRYNRDRTGMPIALTAVFPKSGREIGSDSVAFKNLHSLCAGVDVLVGDAGFTSEDEVDWLSDKNGDKYDRIVSLQIPSGETMINTLTLTSISKDN